MLDFAQFYSAVHGHRPFIWQSELAKRIAAEGWPEDMTLSLPTAAGKTSVLDIAVYALAMQAGRPARSRTAPLRTFFAVDRRLVVDDVTRHAEKIRDALMPSQGDGAVREVRERLETFDSGFPLCVATLRGGMYRSDSWADTPNQPLICISTIDQVGSRLLFRGYGSGEKRRSVDAGLVACDSLIILDEAHLSQPFLDTVHSVRRYMGWAEYKFPSVRVVEMSATAKGKETISFDSEIAGDPELQLRLRAKKIAQLRQVSDLEGVAMAEARSLAAKLENAVIGVVLNTVAAARDVFEALRKAGEHAILLTGRIRPYDRDRILEEYLDKIKAGRERAKSDGRLFVVATQTIEVGADLDFDALVTEAASLDALRQRFGRLDRLGKLAEKVGKTDGIILHHKLRRGDVDRIYGDASLQTWDWLNRRAAGGEIDFGALAMKDLWETSGDANLNAPVENAPILTPAHLKTWVQTHPTPFPDPDVAPFLHGPKSASADVNLVWRADLDEKLPVHQWAGVVQILPPTTTEALPVPIWVVQKWLSNKSPGDVADMEGLQGEQEETGGSDRPFLIWRGPDDCLVGRSDQIRPGDTIILRSSEGGVDKFGWNPSSAERVHDIGDPCANARARAAGGRYIVRLHPSVLFEPGQEEEAREFKELVECWKRDEDDEAKGEILDFVYEKCAHGKRRDWREHADLAGNIYFATRWRKPEHKACGGDIEETDQDDTASLTVAVPLDEHVKGVREHVQRFAKACGLDEQITKALTTAAEAHDLGKCDERFQILLDPGGMSVHQLLAKGAGSPIKQERDRRRALADYPKRARHELWSVALAARAADLEATPLRDLILYLIGTHHGHGRPFAPVWEERSGITVSASWRGTKLQANAVDVSALWSLGSGWTDRFWRLNRVYGFWGLAYLEAILRRADCVQSRVEQELEEPHEGENGNERN